MKNTTASVLLKIVLSLSALALLFVVCWGIPRYMEHVVHVRPSLSPWVVPMVGYGVLLSLPVFVAIALLWQVFGTLPGGDAFTLANAKRFRLISRLAAGDLGLVLVLAVFLAVSSVLPAFLVMCLLGATYVGVVAAVVFHVLAALVRNAAQLRSDNELTI